MSRPTVEMTFDSVQALLTEVEGNLSKGRTFVHGVTGVKPREPCDLIVRHPESGAGIRLAAEAVWVDDAAGGTGFELSELDAMRLLGFVASGDGDADLALPPGVVPLEESSDPENGDAPDGEPSPASRRGSGAALNVYERVRRLSAREQVAMARSGNLSERIALERCYGNVVWEPLLQNPQISANEVARIAKKGSIPKPLVKVIVSNPAWLKTGEVQRALLTNPRVSGMHLTKVLRALAPHDLARVPKQTAYRPQVREAARQLLLKG